ncbi:ankyrin repeat-containing domain protein [Halenospora varia]|nr:ankyrin repeat-containing domain protein [Halenospora varia]
MEGPDSTVKTEKIRPSSSWSSFQFVRTIGSIRKGSKPNPNISSQLSVPFEDLTTLRTSNETRRALQPLVEENEVDTQGHPRRESEPSKQEETRKKEEKQARKARKKARKDGVLTELHIPTEDRPSMESFPVDIIAVHGLNGDPEDTWTHKNGAYWIKDFLPPEFPGARIYTYGYNADVLASFGTGNIDTFAKVLLEEIMNTRTKTEEQRRPIIFICHSMGGLVVKRTLIVAAQRTRYKNIKSSTSSIFFMAVPHRGNDHASIFSKIATVSNFALASTAASRAFGRTRSDLLKSLKKDDQSLTLLTGDFVPLTGEHIKFFSFIEDLTTRPLTTRIVDDVSGSLNVYNEVPPIHMDADHRTIVQFQSRECPNYRKVLAKLREAITEATNPCLEAIAAEHSTCLQSLAFSTMMNRKLETDRAHPRTCVWLLEHPNFTSWLHAPRGILWIKGHPGTGKSTLMAFIHRILLSKHTQNLHALQKSPTGLFRSLLHQIYKQSLIARELIYTSYNEKIKERGGNGSGWEWQFDELKWLFTEVVREVARKKEITLFVDALDEAVTDSDAKAAQSLVGYFHELNNSIEVAEGSVGGLKICISCRHYPVVGSLGPGAEIKVEENNHHDIWNFVHDQLRSGVVGWDEEPLVLRRELVNGIANTAAGVFLWASLRVEKIRDSLNNGYETIEQTREMIDGESNDIFALYEKILGKDGDLCARNRAYLFLQWICFAARPMSVTEVRYAMASDLEDLALTPTSCEDLSKFVKSDSQMAKLVKSLSGGLAEVKYHSGISRVQFIHQTVNDFLRTGGFDSLALPESMAPYLWRDRVVGSSESRLSKSCINYLRMEKTLQDIEDWLEGENTKCKPPFMDYATKYLIEHAEKAENDGVPMQDIVELFNGTPILFETWKQVYGTIEPLNLRRPDPDSVLLHMAASHNLKSVVMMLLKNGVPIETKARHDDTALHKAAYWGHEDMTKLLLNENAEVNATNKSWHTPLESAAINGHTRVVKLLLERGAHIHTETGTTGNALHAAAKKGSLSIVKMLVANGANVNARGGIYETPLIAAASLGDKSIVRFLIEKGAEINIGSEYMGSALMAAIGATENSEEIVRLLLVKGADVNLQCGEYGNALQTAARWIGPKASRINIFQLVLAEQPDVNAQGGSYGTALQALAHHGFDNEELVQQFIDAGANVNAEGGYYGNALCAAAASAHGEEIVQLLLRNGARTDIPGGEYGNVLHAAVISGNKNLVKLFIDQRLDVNARGSGGRAALQDAIFRYPSMVELLLNGGADVNAFGADYGTPLMASIFCGNEKIFHTLLDRGANANAVVGGEYIPAVGHRCALQMAAWKGNPVFVKALLERGALPNVKGGDGFKDVVEMLLDYNADVNFESGKFGSALQAAAFGGHKTVVELLLDTGADPDLQSGRYGSALQAAVGNKSITELLLGRGARFRGDLDSMQKLEDAKYNKKI